MFNLLKLFGGISSLSAPGNAAQDVQPVNTNGGNNSAPQQSSEAEHRNVMAEIIERHERISYRAKRGQ